MAVVCGEMLSEVIRRALLCYVEQGYERTVGARHDGWFVQNRRCHYQLGLDIDPRRYLSSQMRQVVFTGLVVAGRRVG
ncbi:MAG: hypothetical protein JWM45_421 [Pseudonocardiales bacterium]|nr:hypothetical protein [Pseudonocardiales bacterium]